jgi:hypothetical protein
MGDGNFYPALLPEGFHAMSVEAIRSLCVDDARFHLSIRREKIMENLECLVSGLRTIGVRGNLWIDGSFLTEKIDPGDVDVLVELEDRTVTAFTANQQADIDWLQANGEIKTDYDCDSHVLVQWPHGHPSYSHGEWLYGYYLHLFGWDDEYTAVKGIVVVNL